MLTARELEVFTLLGHGMSVPRVAKLLHRSPKTIERHKCAIAKTLNVNSQAEMVAVVTSVGLARIIHESANKNGLVGV